MADAGEDHGDTETVRGGDDVRVADGTAGLNHGSGTGFRGFLDAIREWKEGVGSDNAALQRGLRFHYCDFDGIDAAHLAGADAERGAGAREDDGVGFDVLADFPGKTHGVHFVRRRNAFGYRAQLGVLNFAEIRLLHEHAAEDAFELKAALRLESPWWQLQQAQIFLCVENGFGFIVEAWRGDAFDEELGDFPGSRRVDHAIEG